MRMTWRPGLLLLLVCACGSRARPADGPVRPPTPPADQRAAARLTKTFTGQGAPSLTVQNSFPIAQHLFVDWEHRAALAPGTERAFELTPGVHTVTCADSADADDNPASVTESFVDGYTYRYAISPNP